MSKKKPKYKAISSVGVTYDSRSISNEGEEWKVK